MYIQTPLYQCTYTIAIHVHLLNIRERERERERKDYFVRRSACYIGLFTDTSKCVKYTYVWSYYSFSFVFSSCSFFSKKNNPKKGNRHKQNLSLSLSLSLSHSLTLCSYRYTKPTALLPTPPVVSSKRCV